MEVISQISVEIVYFIYNEPICRIELVKIILDSECRDKQIHTQFALLFIYSCDLNKERTGRNRFENIHSGQNNIP